MNRKHKKRRRGDRPKQSYLTPGPGRIAALDTLRGAAIVGMIVDHIAWVAGQPIEPGSVRLWTRISMPVFCCVMGYLLAGKDIPPKLWRGSDRIDQKKARSQPNWNRFGQIVLAALCVDIIYFPFEGQFEILVSLALTWLLWAALRSDMVWCVAAFLFFRLDPTAGGWGWAVLDYPLSLVVPCVALGMLHRHAGWRVAVAVAGTMAGVIVGSHVLGWALVPPPSSYVLVAAPAAVLLLEGATRVPRWHLPPLEWIGRRPLTVYVVQYWVLLAVRYLASA
ncbi:MAG: DUF1624 domain-containing protein [Planctomycetota bacterium]|nr:MAG: DUF1624 domain-containing protein [Planctomycetota bacterium]